MKSKIILKKKIIINKLKIKLGLTKLINCESREDLGNITRLKKIKKKRKYTSITEESVNFSHSFSCYKQSLNDYVPGMKAFLLF